MEPEGIRGCCPNCGGSNLQNMGYIVVEALAEKAEIWLVDNVITYKFSEITTGRNLNEKSNLSNRYSTEYYDPELFKLEDFGWECNDCAHTFRSEEAKAAIKGPPIRDLLKAEPTLAESDPPVL